jgi:hypothetical protein
MKGSSWAQRMSVGTEMRSMTRALAARIVVVIGVTEAEVARDDLV